MKVKVLVAGKIKEKSYDEKSKIYRKWISKNISLEVIFLKDNDLKKLHHKQLQYLNSDEYTIAMSEDGNQFSSIDFSNFIFNQNKDLIFILGPPDGLSRNLIKSTDFILSLSKFTLPHELAYLVLLEQIYRAVSIRNGTKYHRY